MAFGGEPRYSKAEMLMRSQSEQADEEDIEERSNNINWCKCTQFAPMPTNRECTSCVENLQIKKLIENISCYKNSSSSRTKRSIVEDDDSDNDEEYASSGFYVREKTDKSETKSSDESSNQSGKDVKEKKDCEENGTGPVESENCDDDNKSVGDNSVDRTTEPVESEHGSEHKKSEGDNSEDNNTEHVDDDEKSEDIRVKDVSDDKSNSKDTEKQVEMEEEKEKSLEAEEPSENQKKHDENISGPVKDETENNKDNQNDKNENADETKMIEEGNKNEDACEKSGDSILKDHLTRSDEPKPGSSKDEDENQDAEEMEVEVDFDPSLLCPDISMDVDEAPCVTNDNGPSDGSTSPLLVARTTTDVDEITGVEVTFNLTTEEMDLRSRMYGTDNPVQQTKIHCTACNVHLGSALDGQANRFVHPLLKVLICKNCYHFYTSGEFEKDEDGSELYCRWCGQGGEVLCCSSCEFVFCKRCIRNNFGMKKFKEIRNSDDWNCFRCNMSQLQALRASCAEFWDYYRTQLAKASTMAPKDPTFMTTDHTKCCNQEQKNKDQARSAAAARKRKRKDSEDPDFVPGMIEEPKKKVVPPPNTVPTSTPGILVIRPTVSAASIQAKPALTSTALGGGQVFRVGNTTFRPRTPQTGLGYTVTRPKVSSSSTSPGYIKIVPQRMNQPRPQPAYTVLSGSTKPTFTTIRATGTSQQRFTQAPRHTAITTTQNNVPPMKHEWFEKTVRAAARVNSNLSYTLTQLNRQQSQANSVESLAVVHNKLQEVLSTSINSLIQIRKNLRTEFIAGIKNIKFPAKPIASNPPPMVPLSVRSHQDDDDVIIVSPTVSPTGGGFSHTSGSSSITLGHGISLTTVKKNSPMPPKTPASAIKPISSITPSGGKTGGYLKVKSFSALQSVPSECITIPDDPPMVLDEKTGLVADPLEFCQVDMNDDESSSHSQNNVKDTANKKLVKQSPEVMKEVEVNEDKSKDDHVKIQTKVKIENTESEEKTTETTHTRDKDADIKQEKPVQKSDEINEKGDAIVEGETQEKTMNQHESDSTTKTNDEKTTEKTPKEPKINDEDVEEDAQTTEKHSTSENSENGGTSEIEDEETDSLTRFTYNTSEEPTEEVKKWLGAKVLIKKSRVVDEIFRAKSRVLNGDCENGS